jgi:hypothetical protein
MNSSTRRDGGIVKTPYFNYIFRVMPDDIVIPNSGTLDYSDIVHQFEDFEETYFFVYLLLIIRPYSM